MKTKIILVFALIKLNLDYNLLKIISLILMVISAVTVFFGLFLIAGAYCFLTVQGLEVRNLLTDGGKYTAQYPMGIFKKGLFFVFTFIVPYSFVNYYCLYLYITTRESYFNKSKLQNCPTPTKANAKTSNHYFHS